MLYAAIALLATVAALLLWWMWRREARSQGAALRLPSIAVVLAIVGLALLLYIWRGQHPDTGRWLSDWRAYQDFATQVVAGNPDPELAAQIPLQSLARVLQRQLHLTPSAEGWYVLSLIYSELEAPQVSVMAARRAVEISDNALEPRLLLARSLIEQDQGRLNDEAGELLDIILAEQPGHDGALTLLASAAMQSQDFARALPAWQALLARHGEGEARVLLEKMVEDSRRQLAAQQHYQNLTVVVDAGDGIEAGGNLFVFLRRAGDVGQPLAAVRVLADRFPISVQMAPANWLQAMPAPGTELVAGARYSAAGGGGVEQAGESAELMPVSGTGGALSARVRLSLKEAQQ
jgi:cytochrome c-type biogenesis protein CcmH